MGDGFFVLSPNPISTEAYHTLAAEWGFQWTDKKFPANTHTSTTWKCPEGHIWEACFNNINKGTGCPYCAEVAPKTTNDYNTLAAERGIKWLDKQLPTNTRTPTTWRCPEKHTWETSYNKIQQGTSCPYCVEVSPKTIGDYRALAAARNFVWFGEEFPANTLTPTTWMCYKGHTWSARFCNIQRGVGCPVCAKQKRKGKVFPRKTEDDYRALATEHKVEWLGKELPTNATTKTNWKCSEGHTWEAPYAYIRGGTGCPYCAGVAPKTTDDYYTLAIERQFEWLGQELPVNAGTKTTWQCPEGHLWEARFNDIQQGRGCPHCAERAPKTIDDYRTLATKREFEWLGQALPDNVLTKTTWMCLKGHTWEARFADINQGSGCPHCAGLAPKTINDYRALASERNFVWFGEKFPANTSTKTTWMCYKGHTWKACFANIQQGNGCPHCAERAPKSKDDYYALATKHKFEWIGQKLPANVTTKTTWKCPKGHIWEARFNNIDQGSGCHHCAKQKRKGQFSSRKTEGDYHALAMRREFAWLGQELPANITTKTTWRCPEEHTWEARFSNIQQGTGCPHCAKHIPKTTDDYHALSTRREFEWLGEELPATTSIPTTWRCPKGHTWETPYASIRGGTGCPVCAGNAPKTEDDYRTLAAERGFE